MENIVSKILGKKHQWIIILRVGILLIVVALPTKKETDSKIIAGHNIGDETSTEIEIRLKKLLENMQEVGKVDVMITYQEHDVVEGVVVLAEGADDAVVVRNITAVVQALFDVDSHKIKVIERNLKLK